MTTTPAAPTEQQNPTQSQGQTSQTQSLEQPNGAVLETIKEGAKPKYAGKFDTVEALEDGYKNSFKVFQENTDLKKQLENYSKVPDDYSIPGEIKLSDGEVSYLKALAKKAGLNQDQFVKTASEIHSAANQQAEQFENRKKLVGEKDLIVLEDYVKTVHPHDENLQKIVLRTLINDDQSRTKAMQHRNELLNSKVPGMNNPTISGKKDYEGNDAEYTNAYREHAKNPRDEKAKQKFIEMSRERGEARYAEQIKQMRS